MELKEIALEVARELSEEGFSGTGTDYTLAFYPRFLAAVDAERGKSAAAYAVRNDFEGSHFEYIAMWPEACHEHINDYYERVFADGDQPEKCTVVPLFLSTTIPQWIRVEDQTPERYTEVLVYPAPSDYCLTAQYGLKNGALCWHYSEDESWGVEVYECSPTHWMPLPPPPAGLTK